MADRLRRAQAVRNSCISEIQILNALSKKAKDDASKHSLFKVRFSEIEQVREEFQKQHNIVINIMLQDAEADITQEDSIREKFLSDYYDIKTIYGDLFETLSDHTRISDHNHSLGLPNSNLRLPKIELIKFDGNLNDFDTYLDLYDSLVHKNDALSAIEKYNYMISSLQGVPLALVRTLPMTATNYPIAYETLVKRYSNKRLRAQAHWTQIENCSKIHNENSSALRKLLDTFSENLSALKKLNFPVGEWDFIMVMMMLKRLDASTITRFEHEHGSTEVPSYKSLIDFLEKHCVALDTLSFSPSSPSKAKIDNVSKPSSHSNPNSRKTNSFFVNKNPNVHQKCQVCQENHSVYSCPIFLKKTPYERYQLARGLHLCLGCLSHMHTLKSCKSTLGCVHCGQKTHNSLLHFREKVTPEVNMERSPVNNSNIPEQSTAATTVPKPVRSFQVSTGVVANNSGVLLSTAVIEVRDCHGIYQKFRCLLDSGSMCSFIDKKSFNRLGLTKTESVIEVKGVDSMQTMSCHGCVTLTIRPVGQSRPEFNVDSVIVTNICDSLPSSPIKLDSWPHIANLKLADELFFSPGKVDILLGADMFSQLLLDGRIVGTGGAPDAINTVFGYILMGKISGVRARAVSSFFCALSENTQLETTLKRFWELEAVPDVQSSSTEDIYCEQVFADKCRRDDTGRYVVSLPFRDAALPVFPGSRSLAVNRFYCLERRLLKQPEIYTQYKEFMLDYLSSNHMEAVSNIDSHSTYYIPHHAILKPESSSTKLRVVFNASAKSGSFCSLNDTLLTGGKLQQDICKILLKFRLFRYVLCADVKQMYRMILLTPEQCDFQRIIWRFSPHDDLQDYRLKTLTYGVKSSPFLALRTLLQLVEDEGRTFPSASEAIRESTYVDDVICGHSTLEGANNLKHELISLFEKGGFHLRKWSSNDSTLLADLPESYLSINPRTFEDDSDNSSSLKILGLQWKPITDSFTFSVQPLNRPCTKRNLLSELARVFDPLGFLTPITFLTKHLIQRLWISGIDWDQVPTPDILRVWTQYISELHLLETFEIPRHIIPNTYSSLEIHGFGDASEKGFAAVVYIRALVSNGNRVSTHFVCGKSKVAPLKRISIARLELCAAVLVSKLISYVLKIFDGTLKFEKIYAWSDSKTVLAWVRSSAYRFPTFVANRITLVQETVPPEAWFYVESKSNPADAASRGLFPSQLISDKHWFTGPDLLRDVSNPWLNSVNTFECSHLEEERTMVFNTVSVPPNFLDSLLEKVSSFSFLQRTLAYVLRFCSNSHPASIKRFGVLTSDEMHQSLLVLVKRTQYLHFENEFQGEIFSKPLRKLSAFVDDNNILRVGGRLKYSSLPYDVKHPILLPRKSKLTDLLISYYHKKYLHVGSRSVHFLLAQQFWILSAKRAIRSILSKCLPCWRKNPQPYQPQMGNLPPARISKVKAFCHTGVDFAGPFPIVMNRHRGIRTTKSYFCIFVCFATKAIHIELASDLSSATFLAALQRFIARRGKCEHLYSDCGTNFVGAHNQLKEFMESAASKEFITWHFNPPSSPHFGGLWEAGVKSIKTHLSHVIGHQIFTYEEMNTVLILIESILNSRPLTPLSSDPNDLSVLTPGHFLTLEPLTALTTPDLTSTPSNRLSRWQLIQKLHHDFWKRYSKEYLHTLQQRSKWLDSVTPVEIGALVLIKHDQIPPLKWQIGRIKTLIFGGDQIPRVAEVITASGTIKRPLVKLCPLPVIAD